MPTQRFAYTVTITNQVFAGKLVTFSKKLKANGPHDLQELIDNKFPYNQGFEITSQTIIGAPSLVATHMGARS